MYCEFLYRRGCSKFYFILFYFTLCLQTNGQLITSIAGNGTWGYSGDGGAATIASLQSPFDICVDASGKIFFSDCSNDRIRMINVNGIITTVAGNGTRGYSGDGGPATSASISFPYGVCVDATGNILFADGNNNRIRKIDVNGIITTIVGNGNQGYSGDGGPATSASITFPHGLNLDIYGNMFITEGYGYRIRKVDANGIITTVAGNGNQGYSGDGGPATSASLNFPTGVNVDAFGNIFIADLNNHRIRKVDVNGIITTVAGNGAQGYSGDGSAATSASLNRPYNVVVDPSGNIIFTDVNNNRIRKVDVNGIITTIAGNGVQGYSGDGGSATCASLACPYGVFVDLFGNIFITDGCNARIRKVFPSIAINPITPAFNAVPPICGGASLNALPTTSLDGITGSWSPALNNTTTTTYTFTPSVGQCATVTTLTITVNPTITPTFNSVPTICSGASLNALPTTSLNGITGSWSPALNNTTTTTYTFTPSVGQCATITTLTITVNPSITPTFNSVPPICSGASLNALPTTSLNGITGSWSPALNNTTTTTYTFTPSIGQCATTTLTITVNPLPIVSAGNDTTVLVNQPLYLNAQTINQSGRFNYFWSPTIGLNNPFIQNPVALLNSNITYAVTVISPNGCSASDRISIMVIKNSNILVPNAFAPGGYNKILHPILLGIREFKNFLIFNKYGQQVFNSKNPSIGWDGTFKDQPQNSGVYIWVAEGVDYMNSPVVKKGTVLLIR